MVKVADDTSMDFNEVRSWFDTRVGREIQVTLYVYDMPVATLDGLLRTGVLQDRRGLAESGNIPSPPESGAVVAYEVGSGVLGLSEELVVSAERVGNAVAVQLIEGVEVLAHAWRDA